MILASQVKWIGGDDEWGDEQPGTAVGGFAACDVTAFVWRGGGLWAGGVCVRRFSCDCEAEDVAGAAAKPNRIWQLAVFGAVGVCWESGADQPGTAGEGRVDCRGADRGVTGT